MDMTGEHRIAASREAVWAALNDPAILRACIPGCESLERVSPEEMTAVASVKVGPVTARFTGRVVLSNVMPPESYTITGEGKGGAAGFAKGGADVRLADLGGETALIYSVKAQVGGKLAQIGSRLIDSFARKMADDFFSAFAARVSGGPAMVTDLTDNVPQRDYLDHSPANVQLGDEPYEPVVEDKIEEAAEVLEATEERVEVAAGKGTLGGPVVWGMLAVLAVIVLLGLFTMLPG